VENGKASDERMRNEKKMDIYVREDADRK